MERFRKVCIYSTLILSLIALYNITDTFYIRRYVKIPNHMLLLKAGGSSGDTYLSGHMINS